MNLTFNSDLEFAILRPFLMYFFVWGAMLLLLTAALFFALDRRASRRTIIVFALTLVDIVLGLWFGGLRLYGDGVQTLVPQFEPRYTPIFVMDVALVCALVGVIFAYIDKVFSLRVKITYGLGAGLFAFVLYLLLFVQF